jgi:DNA-binding beta-propeller fold protein YncE
MDDLFTTEPDLTPYNVIVPGVLCRPPVDPTLVPDCKNPHVEQTAALPSRHDGAWWIAHTKKLNFNRPDANNPAVYNRILWAGIAGDETPFPDRATGRDLSKNRQALLQKSKIPGRP